MTHLDHYLVHGVNILFSSIYKGAHLWKHYWLLLLTFWLVFDCSRKENWCQWQGIFCQSHNTDNSVGGPEESGVSLYIWTGNQRLMEALHLTRAFFCFSNLLFCSLPRHVLSFLFFLDRSWINLPAILDTYIFIS